MQAQLTPYEYVNKDSLCTFYHSLFSDHGFVLVQFQVLPFVQLRGRVTLFQGYTWVLGRSRTGVKFKSCPVFTNFWPLG